MAKEINLKDLSPEALKALKKQVEKEQKENADKIQQQRKGYKERVNVVLPGLFKVLVDASQFLAVAKTAVYKEVQELVALKSKVYDKEVDQGSHSFTTDDGTTIIVGNRMIDGWDDTVDIGIQKVTDYLQSLSKDANSKKLVKTILQLLSKDNLKASRVLQLKKIADEIGDKNFIDAITIIQEAYRPNKSKQFVTCRYKDSTGANIELPLSITDVELTTQPVNGQQHQNGKQKHNGATKSTKSAAK
jgi:hypothetical protein